MSSVAGGFANSLCRAGCVGDDEGLGWILPPGGVPELAHTISRNLYGKPPKDLTTKEQDVVVAWIAGRAPVTEAEVRRDLLKDWSAVNEAQGPQLATMSGGAPPPSQAVQTRSVANSALGARLQSLTQNPLRPSSSSSVASSLSVAAQPTTNPTPWSAAKTLTLWEGAADVADMGTFATLAKKATMPGAGAVAEVKFIITGASTSSPQIAFINTNAYEAHHAFAKSALGAKDSLPEFNGRAYFSGDRDVVCGSVVAIGDTGKTPTWALQFLPTDPMTTSLVALSSSLVKEHAPFLKDELVYHPTGEGQADVARAGKAALDAAGVVVKATSEILKDVSFSPLNTGTGFGVLRLIDGADPRPATAKDVVIFTRLPNDLAHTAGVITVDPQTPLSHVNLKAKQNNTPNAYIRGADELADIKKLIGSVVRFEVTDAGYTLRPATAIEASEHLESLRPTTTTTPPRDLTKTKPQPLSSLSHKDLSAFGAKTVNSAEVQKILPPDACVAGVGVPFAFYDAFMKETGLYDVAKAMLAEPRFQTDETHRNNALKKFRRTLRDTPLPKALQQQVRDVEKSFPPGTALRLRSSTNNEDLEGFNGAGLYSSRTWDPQAQTTTQKQSFGDVMKDVWSSLWSFRAVEERTFHRIDHFATAMGVLVHPSYDSDGAAGVAVTKNIYDKNWPGLYVNVQPTDDAVTSPEGGAVPEELLLRHDARSNSWAPQVLRKSNLVADDAAGVLSLSQQQELAQQLEKIQAHFRGVYGAHGDVSFAMDVEFIVDHDRIRVLQARPWVDGAVDGAVDGSVDGAT